MVKPYFDKHINQLIRNLENEESMSGLKPFPDDLPQIPRNRNLTAGGPVDSRYIVIPFITDTHYAKITKQGISRDGISTREEDSLASRDHVANVVEFAKRFNVDAIVHGGDLVDGKSTYASTVSDLKTIVGDLRKAVNQENKKVPVLIAKGNHDNNSSFARAQAGTSKDDMKYLVKGSVLDPILKTGASTTPSIVFDEPYKSDTSFTTKFKDFMDEEEYRVLSKLLLKNGRMSDRNSVKGGNLDVLDEMLKSVSQSKTEATTYKKFAALAVEKRTLGTGSGLTTTEKNTIKKLFFKAAKARTQGSYCYIDIKNVRVIVLDAYDLPGTTKYQQTRNLSEKRPNKAVFHASDYGAFGKRQVEWLANVALKTTKEVIIYCHQAITGTPFTLDGGPKTYNDTKTGNSYFLGNIELVKRIIDDFIQGKSGTHTTYSAIKYYSTGANKFSLVKSSLDPDKKKTPLYYYNSKPNGKYSLKYLISNAPRVKTSVKTNFTTPGTLISFVNGHSHSDRMRKDITGKYVSVRTNASLRSASAFPNNTGFDSGIFQNNNGSTTKRTNTLMRKPETYSEDSWQVMVIDTVAKRVYMYTFGAGMIKENMIQHISSPSSYPTSADKQALARLEPIDIDPRNTGVFPVRRFGYGPNISEKGIYGLQDI